MLINLLFDAVFLGLAWYSILLVINKKLIKTQSKILNETVDNAAVHLASYTGILFFMYLAFSIVNAKNGSYYVVNRMFGPYWFGFWIHPFAYFLLPQLLWFRSIKTNMVIRLSIAFILLFALSIEKFIIIITSLNRDALESSWAFSNQQMIGNIILNWLMKLLIFAGLVWLSHLACASTRFKRQTLENSK